jgi:SRSO17 transposase
MRPELLTRMRQHISIRCVFERLPAGAVARAMGGPSRKDAYFWRLYYYNAILAQDSSGGMPTPSCGTCFTGRRCGMDAKQIRQLEPELAAYLREFDDCFGRVEPARHLHTYVRGQLSDLHRKSIEPIADAAGTKPRDLQHFLALHQWDDNGMCDTVAQIVARDHAHPCSIGTLDETGHPKKGDKTPGVQRQWCGNTGKKDNCVVTVHLGYAAGDFHCLLDGELFLPESWADDRDRCRQAHIPDDMTYRPKWHIGLELYDRAVANGVRFEWLTFDENYGKTPAFLFELEQRGQRYVAEIPRCFTGWLQKPERLHKNHHAPKTGRPRKFPRLKAKSPAASNVEDLFRHSPILRAIPWEVFHVKDTDKGPMVWEAKAAPFYLKRDGLPTRAHWLIIARNRLNPDEVKFFVSNAPQGTPLEVLLHVAFSRWHVERCFQDEKDKLGLSHFEVRNYLSLRRHLVLTAVSHLFLAKMHQKWRGEKSGVEGL